MRKPVMVTTKPITVKIFIGKDYKFLSFKSMPLAISRALVVNCFYLTLEKPL
jgi:hypothetical protein